MRLSVQGTAVLEARLVSMNKRRWGAVVNKNLDEIFNRAGRPSGTPQRTGELIKARRKQAVKVSSGQFEGAFGYVKDYAPHVEYGHRIVRHGKSYGFVPGQKYLHNNVKAQQSIYRQDLLKELKRK